MAISADVLASALQELMPKYSDLFTQWHPCLDRIVLKGNFDKSVLSGPYREFTVVTDGPGRVTQVTTGSEIISGGRRQNAVRGNTYAPRLIYAFDVPCKDLAEANGPQDLARIIRDYPELAMSDLHERLAKQLMSGNGTDVGGFLTFNGDTTYSPTGTTKQGVFDFAAKASQTDTVFGLIKHGNATNPVSGWYNQYGKITSFAVDGLRTMRDVYFQCGTEGSKMSGDVDLILADSDSYLNYLDNLSDHVRVDKVENDKIPGKIREGTKFLGADLFLERAIDTSASTFSSRSGVMYFLKTSTWFAYTLGHDSSKETKGFFDVRGPFRIPDQDVFRYEIVLYMGMHTNQLRCNGVIEGGSVE